MTWRRWLATIVSFVVAIGASVWIVVASWPATGAQLNLPWSAHALALGAALVEIGARVTKLVLSARALGIPLRFRASTRTILGGDFAASITPARSGSEPARFLILREAGMAIAPAILVLFTELFLEMLSLALVALGMALVFHHAGAALSGVVGVVGGYAIFVLGVGAVGVVLSRRNASGPPPEWARSIRLHAGRWRRIQLSLRKLRDSVYAIRGANWKVGTLALLMSVLHVVARVAVLPALILPVAPHTPLAPLILWPLALFYGGIVAPAPGGGGFIEVAFRAVLGGTIPAAVFPAALVWWRFYTFYLYILLGAVAAGRTVFRALQREDKEDEEEERARVVVG